MKHALHILLIRVVKILSSTGMDKWIQTDLNETMCENDKRGNSKLKLVIK